MPTHTFHDRLCAGLRARGRAPAPTRSGRYTAFARNDGRYYFAEMWPDAYFALID